MLTILVCMSIVVALIAVTGYLLLGHDPRQPGAGARSAEASPGFAMHGLFVPVFSEQELDGTRARRSGESASRPTSQP